MNRKIWVLGSSNVDHIYNVRTIAKPGYTVQAERYTVATGGKGANQAVAAAHFGADTGFIGAVGDDADGNLLLRVFSAHEIQATHVAVVGGVPSGNAVVCVDRTGANSITVFPGANQCVKLDSSIPFKSDDILVAQLEVNTDAVEFYFSLAKERGALTILNPSPLHALSRDLIRHTDMVVLNENEAGELGGIAIVDDETSAQCSGRIMEQGIKSVVITLGKQGVLVADSSGTRQIPGVPVDVIDTQGAGDAFLGALAAGLSQGKALYGACRFANAAASFSVTKSGSTQDSLPSDAEMTSFLRDVNLPECQP